MRGDDHNARPWRVHPQRRKPKPQLPVYFVRCLRQGLQREDHKRDATTGQVELEEVVVVILPREIEGFQAHRLLRTTARNSKLDDLLFLKQPRLLGELLLLVHIRFRLPLDFFFDFSASIAEGQWYPGPNEGIKLFERRAILLPPLERCTHRLRQPCNLLNLLCRAFRKAAQSFAQRVLVSVQTLLDYLWVMQRHHRETGTEHVRLEFVDTSIGQLPGLVADIGTEHIWCSCVGGLIGQPGGNLELPKTLCRHEPRGASPQVDLREIAQLDGQWLNSRLHQDVLWLDVAMNQHAPLTICKRVDELTHDNRHLMLREKN
mmetsp:Transcript_59014/g.192495  ORF Transcript_59014/g.192495 Transcript_59014/m.192495 type:complete len:318 (+) Transcript_59014:609-1562(+)